MTMQLSVPLALALVASATFGVWQVVSHGAGEALRIAAMCIAVLLIGAVLQLIAWGGMLVGATVATALVVLETRQLTEQRPWLHEALRRTTSGAASRLALQDRADILAYRPSLPRRLATNASLGFLTVVGVVSIVRGLDPDLRAWLFLGCVLLFLPVTHVTATYLRRVEEAQLVAWLDSREGP